MNDNEKRKEVCVVSVVSSARGRGLSKFAVFAVLVDLRHRQRFSSAFLVSIEPFLANTPLSKSVFNFITAVRQLRTNVGLVSPRSVGYKFAKAREENL